jgi:paraquat-inducible protein B
MAERVAILEAQLRDLTADVHGGPGQPWGQSVRGRLHSMQSALASADKLAKAARAAADAQREATHTVEAARGRRFSRTAQVLLVAAGIAAAAAPYVVAYVH